LRAVCAGKVRDRFGNPAMDLATCATCGAVAEANAVYHSPRRLWQLPIFFIELLSL